MLKILALRGQLLRITSIRSIRKRRKERALTQLPQGLPYSTRRTTSPLILPELVRTSTTPNYRTNGASAAAGQPELPWNPLPGQYQDAAGTDLYRPNLPVNPYRTIDSSTVNLTTFNGTSSEEHNIGATATRQLEGKSRPGNVVVVAWRRAE